MARGCSSALAAIAEGRLIVRSRAGPERQRLGGYAAEQGRLNGVEEAPDLSARIIGVLAPFGRDRKQMRSSFPPERSCLVTRKASNCVRHDSNGGKFSTNWEGIYRHGPDDPQMLHAEPIDRKEIEA